MSHQRRTLPPLVASPGRERVNMSSDSSRQDGRPPDSTVGSGSGKKHASAPGAGENIMLGFRSLSLSAVDPPRHIIANVTGFVVKGKQVRYHLPFCGSVLTREEKRARILQAVLSPALLCLVSEIDMLPVRTAAIGHVSSQGLQTSEGFHTFLETKHLTSHLTMKVELPLFSGPRARGSLCS